MIVKNSISVISNSQLTALSRACVLSEERLGVTFRVAIFSSLPLSDLTLPKRFISYYQRLSNKPSTNEYRVLTHKIQFQKSEICLLFFTRLVPKCVYSKKLTINFHPSLLPDHPGLFGYNSAIIGKQLAVTAHVADDTIDGGTIIRQMLISPFPHNASAAELQQESSLLCTSTIISILTNLQKIEPKPLQNFTSGIECIESILLKESKQ